MSKFLCRCGEIIRISGDIPNPIEWLLIADAAYWEGGDAVDKEALYGKMGHLYRCPSCGRLWIDWESGPYSLELPDGYEPMGSVPHTTRDRSARAVQPKRTEAGRGGTE